VNGYFQSLDWAEGGLPEVCGRLLARRPEAAVPRDDVIAVSFRTGPDFQAAGWTLPFSFYARALEFLDPQRQALLWLIGDCAVDLPELAARFSRLGWQTAAPDTPAGAKGQDDFWNLARARRLVLSCSTFAWWAAATGDALWGEDRHRVICPDPWRPAIRQRLRRRHWLGVAPESGER
jgi:hypothetical protein